MKLKWEQVNTEKHQPEIWRLIDTEQKVVVLQILLSRRADLDVNLKLRRKIQLIFQLYYWRVWYKKLRFYT